MNGIYNYDNNKFLMNQEGREISHLLYGVKIPSLGEASDFIHNSICKHFNDIDKTLVKNLLKTGISTSTPITSSVIVRSMSAYELIRPKLLYNWGGDPNESIINDENGEGLAKLINFTNERVDYPHVHDPNAQFGIKVEKINKTKNTGYVDHGYHIELFNTSSILENPNKFIRLLIMEDQLVAV